MKLPGFTLVFFMLASCNTGGDHAGAHHVPVASHKSPSKPPSNFQDTLVITVPAAVFFHPDSLQLQQIKNRTDSTVFDGTMHESFYQMRYSRLAIKKNWPQLKIFEAKHYRYLLFVKKDDHLQCIDLDSIPDALGLLVFDTKKSPISIDMTNIETQVSFYLDNK